MMRQAGRYLPDFMKLKAKYDFFTRCRTPELATEITVMPINQVGTDAAILFSDILVVPQAMNVPFEMKMGLGPWLENPVRSAADVEKVVVPDVEQELDYVMEAIKMTVKELDSSVPLIGFAGSPWTILCYTVEGQGSKSFDKAKGFCFSQPEASHTSCFKKSQILPSFTLELRLKLALMQSKSLIVGAACSRLLTMKSFPGDIFSKS